MKKMYVLLVALLVIMLLSDELKSQTSELQWGKLNTGTDASILGIASIGDDTIIACGSDGTIIKSVDSGRTWQSKQSGTSKSCNEIKFADKNVGYIIAGLNDLLKTVDGGETWTTIASFGSTPIRKLFVVDADTLYMEQNLERRPNVSSLIKSIDGGGLWSSNFVCFREDDYYGAFLNQMFFIDNVGYILTSGHGSNHPEIVNGVYVYTIHKSVDYGNTWDTIAEFGQHWSPPKDEIINIVERPSALFFSTIDSGAIYLEESKVSTKDGFETSTKAENNGGDYLNISKDHTNTLFQKNGKHCAASYYFSDEFPYYFTVMQYSNDNGKSWIKGKEVFIHNYPTNPISEIFFTTHRVTDSIFYIGSNNGIILRSPAFPIGVDENKTLDINIYPNPTTDKFTVYNSQFRIDDIFIYDLTGRLCKNINVSSMEDVVNIAEFKSGMYLVKINTEKGSIIKKITKH